MFIISEWYTAFNKNEDINFENTLKLSKLECQFQHSNLWIWNFALWWFSWFITPCFLRVMKHTHTRTHTHAYTHIYLNLLHTIIYLFIYLLIYSFFSLLGTWEYQIVPTSIAFKCVSVSQKDTFHTTIAEFLWVLSGQYRLAYFSLIFLLNWI